MLATRGDVYPHQQSSAISGSAVWRDSKEGPPPETVEAGQVAVGSYAIRHGGEARFRVKLAASLVSS